MRSQAHKCWSIRIEQSGSHETEGEILAILHDIPIHGSLLQVFEAVGGIRQRRDKGNWDLHCAFRTLDIHFLQQTKKVGFAIRGGCEHNAANTMTLFSNALVAG